MAVSIHPSIDQGVKQGTPNFAGGTLTCKCTQNPVTVSIKGDVAFRDVVFSYEPGKPVLHGISFESKPGTVTALA